MAFTLDSSLYVAASTANPLEGTITVGSGSKVIVLGIYSYASARTGGTPTYGLKNFKLFGSGSFDYGEGASELYYLEDASAGSFVISVPNTGGASNVIRAMSFKAASGYIPVLDSSNYRLLNGATLANPSCWIPTTAGGFVFQHCTHGSSNLPTAYTHTSFRPADHGVHNSWSQWALLGSTATINVGATQGADEFELRTFSWKEQAAPPNAPTLNAPSNGAKIPLTVTYPDTSVSWNTQADASSYWLQVGSDNAFSNLLVDVSGVTYLYRDVSGYYNENVKNDSSTYWRVAAINAGGVSDWSTRSFRAFKQPKEPSILTPGNGSTSIPLTGQTFLWRDASYANKYELQIASSSDFSSPVYDSILDVSTYTYASTFTSDTSYYWRVRGNNYYTDSSIFGSYSKTFEFKTTPQDPPDAPTLNAPIDGYNYPLTLTSPDISVSWLISSDASSYWMQLSSTDAFTTTVKDSSGITSLYIDVSGWWNENIINDASYYWRIAGINSGGTGDWSEIREFNPKKQPKQVSLFQPTDLSSNIPLSGQEFLWKDASYSNKYQLDISDISSFSSTLYNYILDVSTYTQESSFALDTSYYWRVRGNNFYSDGSIFGEYSEIWVFKTFPGSIYGGILKYYNGSQWVECVSTMAKYYDGGNWIILPNSNIKIFTQNVWKPLRMDGSVSVITKYTDNFESYSLGSLAGQGDWLTCKSEMLVATNAGDKEIRGNSSTEALAYINRGFGANQYAQIQLSSMNSNNVGVAVRCSSGNGYFASVASGDTLVKKLINGTATTIYNVAIGGSLGDVIYLSVNGTTLKFLKNGSPVAGIGDANGEFTDGDVSIGQPGVSGIGNSRPSYADNFECDNL